MKSLGSKRFQKVYIEISNVCNLQCEFCPEVIRDKKFMDEELFTKIIKGIAPLTSSVCFHLMGEPMVHPEFGRYIEICAGENIDVQITSNGVLLNEKRSAFLLNPTVKQVNFSVHSFEANFPGKDISQYLTKIFAFTQEAFEKRPDLYINYRLWNLQDSTDHSLTNKIVYEKIKEAFNIEFDSTVDVGIKKSVKLLNRLYLHFDSRFQWPNQNHPKRQTKGHCYGLTSHMGILADGTVVPCCLDKEGVIALGNCRSQNILEILESERVQKMHKGFKDGNLVEDLCQRCTFISRFDKKKIMKVRHEHVEHHHAR
ncbi:MAG: radical SAM/SPASM domain-containing protein [Oligoflexia bacterium]|nr:radical SAM/SPASM domain-containing protein [Oligoflexia bacterium]